MAHINLGDTKAQVRSKQGLQGPEKDEDFTKFEQKCENVYKFQFQFDPKTPWANLGVDVERAKDAITNECTKDNLILGDLRALAGWKLYQLHKTAQKTNKNRSTKHATTVAWFSQEPGSSMAYDPVKDAAKDAKDAK